MGKLPYNLGDSDPVETQQIRRKYHRTRSIRQMPSEANAEKPRFTAHREVTYKAAKRS